MVVVYLSSDISDLLVPQPLPHSAVQADSNLMKAADQDAPQGDANNPTVITAVAASVAATMLVVSMLIVGITWRTRRRQQESDGVVIIQDIPGFMEVSQTFKSAQIHISTHCY